VRVVLQAVALVVLALLPVSTQDDPDFSGEWVRVEPSPGTEATLVVRQDNTSINIEHESFPGPRSGTYGVGTFGGVVGGAIDGCGGGSLQWMWKDATLIVTRQQTTCESGNTKQSKSEEVWSLDTDGRLVIVTKNEETGSAPATTRFVYSRKR
jgi:hypothetical protein